MNKKERDDAFAQFMIKAVADDKLFRQMMMVITNGLTYMANEIQSLQDDEGGSPE